MNNKSIFKTITLITALFIPTLLNAGFIFAHTQGSSTQEETTGHSLFRATVHNRTSGMKNMIDALELSDEQMTLVQGIRDEYQPEVQEKMKKIIDGRDELLTTAETTLDENTIRTLADNQGRNIADMIVLRAQIRQQIYFVLSPEQQSLFDKTLKENLF